MNRREFFARFGVVSLQTPPQTRPQKSRARIAFDGLDAEMATGSVPYDELFVDIREVLREVVYAVDRLEGRTK